jgi:hypothetical protein
VNQRHFHRHWNKSVLCGTSTLSLSLSLSLSLWLRNV